ncbi:MAG: MBL fold metallo-hydrolase, partial [Desulfobulbaceae bacterium]|nr:MBL fold metallo-hydrolase [Desulfobulbaceae bacterium]
RDTSQLLLDCGFSVPHCFFTISDDPNALEMVWLSHFHGDHFFGMPLLLLRFWEMGRTRPLTIVGQQDVETKVRGALDLAYPGFETKLSYDLRFQIIEPGVPLQLAGLTWHFAQTVHSQSNLGLLLDDGDIRLYYSGDGRPTDEVQELVQGCDLAIHEAFKLEDEIPNHGSIAVCIALAEKTSIKQLALVHLERTFRKTQQQTIDQLLHQHPFLTLPTDGDSLLLKP